VTGVTEVKEFPDVALRVTGLTVEYRSRRGNVLAVDGVSLALHGGERLGVVGESGSGKSTLGLAIAGLLPPSAHVSGSVRYADTEIVGASRGALRRLHGREVAVIFQDAKAALDPVRTIGAQVVEAVRARGDVERSQARRIGLGLLEEVEIPEAERRLKQYPHELSGGMRQRVTVAIALAQQPRILIADEPTSALDVTSQAALIRLLRRLGDERRMTTMLITHDLGVVANFAETVFVLYAGRSMEIGSVEGLFGGPRHPYTDALVRAVPRLDHSRMARLPFIDGTLPHDGARVAGCVFEARCSVGRGREACLRDRPELSAEKDGGGVACHFPIGERPKDVGKTPENNGNGVVRTAESTRDTAGGDRGSVLVVENLGKRFLIRRGAGGADRILRALEGISFRVGEREALGFVGESGSGKTTLARIIVGLANPSEGFVRAGTSDGGDGARMLSRSKAGWRPGEVQMIFQDPTDSLDPYMTVEQIVREPLELTVGGRRSASRAPLKAALDDVGLSGELLPRRPMELSVGQRQRVAIARSLTTDPVLIVADEAVSALDVSARGQVLNLLADIQRERKLACIHISHDLSVVRHICDRVAVLHAGRLVEIAKTDDLFTRPRHPYTRALLDAVPVPDPAPEGRGMRVALRGELPDMTEEIVGCAFRSRCLRAQVLCSQVDPPLQPDATRHAWACHFPLADGETLA
jgi:peptide/nickel transport system ATP-binding protein